MSNHRLTVGSTALVSLGLMACSSPNQASNASFTKALKSTAARQACGGFQGSNLYVKTGSRPRKAFPIVRTKDTSGGDPMLERLVTVGLLARSEQTLPASASSDGPFLPTPVIVYSPTSSAADYLKGVSGERRDRRGPTDEMAILCRGHAEVVGVDSFTAPADAFGMKVSRVQYRWQVAKPPAWLRKLADLEEHGSGERIGQPKAGSATLMLTDRGWIDQHDLS